MDIKKPSLKREPKQKETPSDNQTVDEDSLELQPIDETYEGLHPSRKHSLVKIIIIVLGGLLAVLIGLMIWVYVWYSNAILPATTENTSRIGITIETGMTPSQIGDLLDEEGVIRSSLAFEVYTRREGVRDKLQAGSYSLSPKDSLAEIVAQLQKAQANTFNITLFPGGRLFDNSEKPAEEKHDVRTRLVLAGYSNKEVDEALEADYSDHPLLKGKPGDADLEGYIYGDTYNINTTATAEDIIRRAMDEMYDVITELGLESKFEKQGLTLREGIILASIVQAEVTNIDDQRQAAQVFLRRLEIGMQLGSDVTYQYIADKLGIARDYNLDNPYNTRKFSGLPPGPVSNPGQSALEAVANPAEGTYLYFVAGEDGKTYFAHTNEEHEQNVVKYCGDLCLVP